MPRRAPARSRTDRDALRQALIPGQAMTPRQLSQIARLSEDDVLRHLEHVMKSVEAEGGEIVVHPAECLGCGFVFEGRRKLSKPGKCPECHAERIAPPAFELVEAQ
jgi:hypothetical protein